MAEETKEAQAKPALRGKKARPTNCASTNARIKRKSWYYRNGNYYANKRVAKAHIQKLADEKSKAEAEAKAKAETEVKAKAESAKQAAQEAAKKMAESTKTETKPESAAKPEQAANPAQAKETGSKPKKDAA